MFSQVHKAALLPHFYNSSPNVAKLISVQTEVAKSAANLYFDGFLTDQRMPSIYDLEYVMVVLENAQPPTSRRPSQRRSSFLVKEAYDTFVVRVREESTEMCFYSSRYDFDQIYE